MIAKYKGTCRSCGGQINKGDSILWKKGIGAEHEDCATGEVENHDEDDAAGFERGTLANDRRMARRGLTVVRFPSGATMTQNSRGRCEDAPCCGCCS